jgi:hypothetical protein
MDLGIIAQLGVAAFAILVMWWMYDSATKERNEHFKAFRELESDIRNKISVQLMENTNAMLEHSKIMETVVHILSRHEK